MMTESSSDNWRIFKGKGDPREDWKLPPPPGWRPFGQENQAEENRRSQRAKTFQPQENAINMVNAAMYLRRPLLITGRPGTGKSSLAYAVARELMLGEVLYWPITTRTTLKNGLYDYDAIGRLQDAQQQEAQRQEAQRRAQAAAQQGTPESAENQVEVDFAAIGDYITLGPLGTALIPSKKPRVLLIDEIDKSDIDLPNDLLTILEEGRFEIPELVRIKEKAKLVAVRTAYPDRQQALDWQQPKHTLENGVITCTAFPLIFLTSNGERAFPPAFLRRCLRLQMQMPTGDHLRDIVNVHLEGDFQQRKQAIAQAEGEAAAEKWYEATSEERKTLIETFEKSCKAGKLISTDQLLNALFLLTQENPLVKGKKDLQDALMKQLTSAEDG
jgi:MoxR-like ATPase